MQRLIELTVNGKKHRLSTDENRPLLEVLREDLGLTGAKYGCGEGECGACTVLLEGQAIRSCITDVADAVGQEITTIEGLAEDGKLHPVQQAFVDKHAVQCGYCVPGQIMTAAGLLGDNAQPTRQQIIDTMTGNICRCCNYQNLRGAVQHAAQLAQEGQGE